MTQKQIADEMNISDKTVSKWERGQGCTDIVQMTDYIITQYKKVTLT